MMPLCGPPGMLAELCICHEHTPGIFRAEMAGIAFAKAYKYALAAIYRHGHFDGLTTLNIGITEI
jgi:hypothetical protein